MSKRQGSGFERFVKAKAMSEFLKKKTEDEQKQFKAGKLFRAIKIACYIVPALNLLLLLDLQLEGKWEEDSLAGFERIKQTHVDAYPPSQMRPGTGTRTEVYLELNLERHGLIEIRDNNSFTLPKQNADVVIEYSRIFGMPLRLELVESGTSHRVANSIFSVTNIILFGLASLFSIALLILSARTSLYIITFTHLTGTLNLVMLLKFIYYFGV